MGLQAGLLSGLGLAFVGGEQPARAEEDTCPLEGGCTFKKVNFMIIMEYSTAMNSDFDGVQTRWEAAEDAVKSLAATKFYDENLHLGLMRFGHDPSEEPGTTIAMDTSEPPLTDGQALDVLWYDADADDKGFFPCNGEALVTALESVPEPLDGQLTGIGTWTKGALDYAKELVAQSRADHPEDNNERYYANLVLTSGVWTGVDGKTPLSPAEQNPAIASAELYDDQDISTYVVFFGDKDDAEATAAATELAMAGGTTLIHGDDEEEITQTIKSIAQYPKDELIVPQCNVGKPRIMVLLDASSTMLNVDGNTIAGDEYETPWDEARLAFDSLNSSLQTPVYMDRPAEDLIHLGLAVFGDDQPMPGEQRVLIDYGPCHKDNLTWALDPETSCADGCDDPWGGPPLAWTFLDGQADKDPPFDDPTTSHMPKCLGETFCAGSGAYTHLGLQLIRENKNAYHGFASDPNNNPPFAASDETVYANILITDGSYSGYSTDAQVQAELTQMYAGGITTYVIGIGEGLGDPATIAELTKMAEWGSDGAEVHFAAADQTALEDALGTILEAQVYAFDPCCAFPDCSTNPELSDENECDPNDPDACNEDESCQLDEDDQWYVCEGKKCGNGRFDPGEECDDGNNVDSDGCPSHCVFEECGDGFLQEGEECDDANTIDNDGCNNACQLPVCGNGVVQDDEECDDGNDVDDDYCTNTCAQNTPSTTTDSTGDSATESDTGMATGTSDTLTTGAASSTGKASDTSTASDTDSGPGIDNVGCGCAAQENAEGQARGLLGVLLGLGFAGMTRRRRRRRRRRRQW